MSMSLSKADSWKKKHNQNRIKFAIALENASRRQSNHEAESKMLEGESGVNWNAAPAANHCEARHSCITCRWSSPRVEGDSPAKGMGGGREMAVRINFKGDDKRSGTG